MNLILHLSDLHISENNNDINAECERIVKVLDAFARNKENVTDVLIVVSGDLTQSGTEEDFYVFDEFIGKLRFLIKKKLSLGKHSCFVITCPGNHDVYFDHKVKREEIMAMPENEKFNYYEKSLDYYYKSKYANKWNNSYITKIERKLGKTGISFTLINSVVGSRIEDEDTDKGLHMIPNICLDEITPTSDSINVLVLHHSLEWFEENQWRTISDKIESGYNAVLYGHEHINRDRHMQSKNKNVDFICGGPLFDKNSSFNVLAIFENKIQTFKFQLEKNNYKYYNVINEFKISKQIKKDDLFDFEFIEEINDYSLLQDVSLLDIYVFPLLSYVNSEDKDKTVENFNDFKNIIDKKDKQFILIEGDEISGKTELSKYLFLEYRKDFYPLLINANDIGKGYVENSFKNVFKKEYDIHKISFTEYEQINVSDKILIIDDYDYIENDIARKLINYSAKNFEKIIILKNINNVNFVKSVTDNIPQDNTLKFSILPMLYRKREELIHKICLLSYKSKNNEEINNIVKSINQAINNQLTVLNLTPQFIVLCVNALLRNEYQFNSSNGFTSIFQSNITRQLENADNIDLDKYLYLLQLLAYAAHIKGEYPITFNLIYLVIEEYNKKGMKTRKGIATNDFINNLEKCRLLQKSRDDGNKYVFVNSNYYAYFIAKNIVTLISEGTMDDNILNKLVKEMCFGVNSDILLYISYILQTSKIIDTIFNVAEEFFSGFETEIDLNPSTNNIKYLFLKQSKLCLDMPNKKEKEDTLKKREQDENAIVSNKKSNVNYYDYTEDDLENSFIKIKLGIKYIEIISKLLPDFIHLDSLNIEKMIVNLQIFANKLLYYILKPYEELYEIDSEILREICQDTEISKDYQDPDSLKNEIQKISHSFILNLYNMIARLSASPKTIFALDNLCDKSRVTSEILNLMQHENINTLDEFAQTIIDIDKKYDNVVITNYLKRILRKHIVLNPIKFIGVSQKVVNMYITNKPNKKQVSRMRIKQKM